ncbi:MAG: bifunctional 4-hydroxy-2-oxoglutarate aldolase/2-dehydro-3-deoxy-phosphogluconate aldolase [Legionellaceae bacterium]|nr:bifunctional 4-hydroxy-2-oxoglutarate aldolase/2-dehydro-3-deoxy-phosphogluconate aldolase [Legionellaceae bacterium]
MTEKAVNNHSIIITLDVDALLFEKLEIISAANFTMVEINSSEPAILKKAIQDFPRLQIGSGNVINSQQLEDCCKAGVHFATSPGFLTTLAQTAEMYSIKYIPSIATISEAMQAIATGCQNVKVFPANLNLCTALNKSLPLLRLFPAEIEWDEVEHFMNLPAVAAVSIINPELQQLKNLNDTFASV